MHDYSSTLMVGWSDRLVLRPIFCELKNSGGAYIVLKKSTRAELIPLLESGEISVASLSPIKLFDQSKNDFAAGAGLVYGGKSPDFYIGQKEAHEKSAQIFNERLVELKAIFKHAQNVFGSDMSMRAKYILEAARDIKRPSLQSIPAINLNSAHQSGRALIRMIYFLCFGEEAYKLYLGKDVQGSEQGTYNLCTGNASLTKRADHRNIMDLAQIWELLTGFPFVAEVFQKSNHKVQPQWVSCIQDSAKLASTRVLVEPSTYMPETCPLTSQGNEVQIQSLWQNVSYVIGPLELESIKFFLTLYQACFSKLNDFENAAVRMSRWSEKSQAYSIN